MARTNEIGDHLNGVLTERLHRHPLEVVRHRGDDVTFLNRIANGRLERRVLAQQSDVCAMQGGDHGESLALFGQNPPGIQRRACMGDGVVHVQQVERTCRGHLHHFGRQHQFIGRVVEKRILGHLHLVVKHTGVKRPQAHGLRVRDEMHLMPLVGQGLAQFRGHHAAPAVGRVAYDSNAKWGSSHGSKTACGSQMFEHHALNLRPRVEAEQGFVGRIWVGAVAQKHIDQIVGRVHPHQRACESTVAETLP